MCARPAGLRPAGVHMWAGLRPAHMCSYPARLRRAGYAARLRRAARGHRAGLRPARCPYLGHWPSVHSANGRVYMCPVPFGHRAHVRAVGPFGAHGPTWEPGPFGARFPEHTAGALRAPAVCAHMSGALRAPLMCARTQVGPFGAHLCRACGPLRGRRPTYTGSPKGCPCIHALRGEAPQGMYVHGRWPKANGRVYKQVGRRPTCLYVGRWPKATGPT